MFHGNSILRKTEPVLDEHVSTSNIVPATLQLYSFINTVRNWTSESGQSVFPLADLLNWKSTSKENFYFDFTLILNFKNGFLKKYNVLWDMTQEVAPVESMKRLLNIVSLCILSCFHWSGWYWAVLGRGKCRCLHPTASVGIEQCKRAE